MKEILNSIKANLYDRTSSPLSGAFVASWAVWNYRFIVVLLSGVDADNKFQYISDQLYPDLETVFWIGVAGPLITAAFYLFAYPYPAKWVYKFVKNRQMELLQVRKEIEDERPLTKEDERQIIKDMAELRIAYNKEIEGIRKESQQYRALAESKKSELDEAIAEQDRLRENLDQQSRESPKLIPVTAAQEKIIALVSGAKDVPEQSILRNTLTDAEQTNRDIQHLLNVNMIRRSDSDDGPLYNLSPLGFSMALEKVDLSKLRNDPNLSLGQWDADRDGMKFEAEYEGRHVDCFISREALEDNFVADDSEDPRQVYADNAGMIEDVALFLIHNDHYAGGELVIESKDVELFRSTDKK